MNIDISFDFRTDANGRDPDKYSPTLRRYHRVLWSKALPNGVSFDLSDTTPGAYLYHRSNLGEFFLTSDSVIQTFTRWKRTEALSVLLTKSENAAFFSLAYTIGGMMIFPGNQVGGMRTINVDRGFSASICDRFDLTLECIRRHYNHMDSPLAPTLTRHADFFALFNDFHSYVSFFLLDDLVDHNLGVKFFMPFDDFHTSSYPKDLETYKEYRRRSIDFIRARNHRIQQLDT
jgi:hypothetical protein